MELFFDDTAFHLERRGGVSRYITQLALLMSQAGGVDRVHLFAGWNGNAFVRELPEVPKLSVYRLPRPRRFAGGDLVRAVSLLWRRVVMARLSATCKESLIYHASFYPLDRVLRRLSSVSVCTIHDMIPELQMKPSRAASRYRDAKRDAIFGSARIACVSESSRQEMLRFFPEAQDRTEVVHNTTGLFKVAAQEELKDLPASPFFLMVGQRKDYKNGLLALRAFAAVAARDPSVELVLCGGSSCAQEERLIEQLGLRPKIRYILPEDTLLKACYQRAQALLYPSRAEGFGLPVLEAMLSGCPVITTPLTSMPEVGGDAVLYAGPDDLELWVAHMYSLLALPSLKAQLARAGRFRSRLFTPEKQQERMREFYLNALSGAKIRANA